MTVEIFQQIGLTLGQISAVAAFVFVNPYAGLAFGLILVALFIVLNKLM